jgi:glutaminase
MNGVTAMRVGAADATRVRVSPLIEILERAYDALVQDETGAVATYIPELGSADPQHFGIAVATIDGDVFAVGDARLPFTIQSISKPLVFGMALEEHGTEPVLEYVGVEPSGNPFNAVTVEASSGRPFNPMVNAGAIVTTALVAKGAGDMRLGRIREGLGRFAGRPLDIDEQVYASERETGDRNRALGWLMRSFGVLDGDVDSAVDAYFGQCSMLVTCRDLAMIGATLANDGVNPRTAERALASEHVANVLSVMTTCGMYDMAGEWVYNVGLPAKSGVAGGVLAVLPGQLGIGVFSPPLDLRGNSVRGMKVCEQLSRDLRLHVLSPTAAVQSAVRRVVSGEEVSSNRVRNVTEEEMLAEHRDRIAVFELQGDLYFATAEKVHRSVAERADDFDFAVLDLTRIGTIDHAAREVMSSLVRELGAAGRAVVSVRTAAASAWSVDTLSFVDTDAALEWCEERLLERVGATEALTDQSVLDRFDILADISPGARAAIELAMAIDTYEEQAIVCLEGEVADTLYFLLGGRVSVMLPLQGSAGSARRRLATFGAGVAFGEMALIDEGRRSADVVCDEKSVIGALRLSTLAALDEEHPGLLSAIHVNIARLLARRLRAANAQIRALAR